MAKKKKVMVKSGGVGTTIAKAIKATGLDTFVNGKDCGCKEREAKLNKLLPYRFKARCMTEQEYKDWKDFTEKRTLKLSWDEILFVCKTHSDIFNRQYWKPDCLNCQGTIKVLIEMIKKLDLVFEQYEK
jgi:hypothetical protein